MNKPVNEREKVPLLSPRYGKLTSLRVLDACNASVVVARIGHARAGVLLIAKRMNEIGSNK